MARPGRHRGDGPFFDYRVGAFVPAARHRAGLSSAGRNRLLVVAVACLAVAATLGGIAQSGSSATAGGDNAAPGRPLPEWQPQPDVTSPGPISITTAPPERARRTAGPGRRVATMRARPAPLLALRPTSPAPAARRPAARPPAVVVTYLVASQGPAGFQGEIQVTNNTGQPIGNWQIVVALYGDVVTSFTNAAGYLSNGILLLSPASSAQVAPPDGGVLDVFFVAEGTQTAPAACAFDGIPCG
jgi:hypothetical protein